MSTRKSFCDVLNELYKLYCQRKGYNPNRGMSPFAAEAMVDISYMRKLLKGKRIVPGREIVNNILDGLYNDGDHGIITAKEKAWWHEQLHKARVRDMQKLQFLPLINSNLTSLLRKMRNF